jgi:hypothetical protein
MSELKLNNGAAPSIPASGKTSIFADSADKRIKQIDDDGVIRTLGRDSKVTQLSAVAATSGATENLLLAGNVPLNSVVVGDVFRIRLIGTSSSTGTLIFRVRVGPNGTTADSQAWISITSAAQVANQRAGFEALLTVRAIGVSGAIQCEGLGHAQAALLPTLVAAVTTPTIDTTADWYIDLCVTCSIGAFTAQQAVIEKL